MREEAKSGLPSKGIPVFSAGGEMGGDLQVDSHSGAEVAQPRALFGHPCRAALASSIADVGGGPITGSCRRLSLCHLSLSLGHFSHYPLGMAIRNLSLSLRCSMSCFVAQKVFAVGAKDYTILRREGVALTFVLCFELLEKQVILPVAQDKGQEGEDEGVQDADDGQDVSPAHGAVAQ